MKNGIFCWTRRIFSCFLATDVTGSWRSLSPPICVSSPVFFPQQHKVGYCRVPCLALLGEATENLPQFLLAFREPYRASTAKQPTTRLGSVALQSLLSVVAAWRGSYPVVWKCQWQGTAVCCGLLNASSWVSSRDIMPPKPEGKKLCVQADGGAWEPGIFQLPL